MKLNKVHSFYIHDSYPFLKQSACIKPFTLLEGENGTGKTLFIKKLARFMYGTGNESDYVVNQDGGAIYTKDAGKSDIAFHHLGFGDTEPLLYALLSDAFKRDFGSIKHYIKPYVTESQLFRQLYFSVPVSLSERMIFAVLATIGGIKHGGKTNHIIALENPHLFLSEKNMAILTSILIQIASEGEISFIVETHSQAVLDRARIMIREDIVLWHGDLAFLYFESGERNTTIHNITFDEMANMTGTPTDYHRWDFREFRRGNETSTS